jgi:hypothetical protein
MKNLKYLIGFMIVWGVAFYCYALFNRDSRIENPTANKVETCMVYPSNELTKENVYAEIMRCDIKFSGIVLKQTWAETGHYTSKNCLVRNNLTGMKGGKETTDNPNGYRIFDHWRHSIQNYKEWQAKRITDDCGDYYDFLKQYKYSENPNHYDSLLRGVDIKIIKQ